MAPRIGFIALLVLSLTACASASRDAATGDSLASELQLSLHKSLDQNLTVGATLGVAFQGHGAWTGASGFADPLGHEVLMPRDRFRIGSITKTFTAVLILQLAEEQALYLDDPVTTWLPTLPLNNVTIRQLLNHTSGIYNYTKDERVLSDLGRAWDPAELVDIAMSRPSLYPPGSHWSYSNTNYVLLGMVIEKVTGFPYSLQLRKRILEPYGLANTFLEGQEDIPGGFVTGTLRQGHAYIGFESSMHPSVVWSAGAIVSNASDLLSFSEALFGGMVIGEEMLAEMLTPATLSDGSPGHYGLGIVTVQTQWGPYYWHNGRVSGFTSFFGYFPDRGTTVTALVNTTNSEAWQVAGDAWRVLLDGAQPAIAVN